MSRSHPITKFPLTLLPGLAILVQVSGCLEHPLKPTEFDVEEVRQKTVQLEVNKDVDILFVMDNSGSMGEEQAILASNFDAFIEVLERPEVKANYRLGVTTSDNGNPQCSGTTPEAGALVHSSCLNRLGAFTDQSGSTNVSSIACEDICEFDSAQLGIDANDPDYHPWLENIGGSSNLPPGITTTQAFQCLAPQGINGCGFESQLESMNKSLIRFETQSDPAYGFMRERAILAIVQVTDEADCSYSSDWASIFATGGNKVFWHSPQDSYPTSAVCWNAGTACTDDGNGGYNCEAADYDVDGNLIPSEDPSAADNAVLHPIARYIERLEGIERDKQESNSNQEVIVGLIAGVGDAGSPSYADSADATFMANFGIGPGCSAAVQGSTPCASDSDCIDIGTEVCGSGNYCMETQTAIAPVRLAEFTEHFTEDNMFSVCSPNYALALEKIAETIEDQLKPACYTECVQDQDLTTPNIVEPDCTVTETVDGVDGVARKLEECLRSEGSKGEYVLDPNTNDYAMPNSEATECYALAVDAGMTSSSTLDDMSQGCIIEGYNLEFRFARKPGHPALSDSVINAGCLVSELPQEECPGLD